MAVKRGINIRKGRRQTKHGLPIGSADRAAQDLALSRYKEPAEPLEGQGEPIAPKALVRRRVALRSVRRGRSDAHAPLVPRRRASQTGIVENDMLAPLRWSPRTYRLSRISLSGEPIT